MVLVWSLNKPMLHRTEVGICKPETLQTAHEQRKEPTQLGGALSGNFFNHNFRKLISGMDGQG